LGDLAQAANRYNQLWLDLERSAESLDTLRYEIMAILLRECGCSDKRTVQCLTQAYDDIRCESGVLAYPGVPELLSDLKQTYRLGLYTNGPSFLQWQKINSLAFDQLFDAIIVAGDVDIYKPDPQAFSMLSKELCIDPGQMLFVGDNFEADIEGAHHAGMYTAWIKHDTAAENSRLRTEDSLKDHQIQPTITVSETAMLREVLL